jgi:hypothetical protein
VIDVVLLVAFLNVSGYQTRVISAEWPFFTDLPTCQRAAMHMKDLPRTVGEITCERHVLDVSTGRVVR